MLLGGRMDFWTVFAAFLAANLLTISFVWGLREYSRHEREGSAGGRDSHTPAIAVLLPALFLAGALYLAFGGT